MSTYARVDPYLFTLMSFFGSMPAVARNDRDFLEAFFLWVYTPRAHANGMVEQIIEETLAFPHPTSRRDDAAPGRRISRPRRPRPAARDRGADPRPCRRTGHSRATPLRNDRGRAHPQRHVSSSCLGRRTSRSRNRLTTSTLAWTSSGAASTPPPERSGPLAVLELAPALDQLRERRDLKRLAEQLQDRLEVAVADHHATQLQHALARGEDALLQPPSARGQRQLDAAAVVRSPAGAPRSPPRPGDRPGGSGGRPLRSGGRRARSATAARPDR